MVSFVSAANAMGYLAPVRGKLDAATLEMIERPAARSSWPGPQFIALLEAIEAHAGREAVKAAAIRGSRERMGPIVRPLAGVLLSLAKVPMLALLSKLDSFVEAGVQGIDARFEPHEGRPGGLVTFTFPHPVNEVMSATWHGLFDVGFTLAKGGRIVSEHLAPRTHRFEVTW
jgi:hypothetical protein